MIRNYGSWSPTTFKEPQAPSLSLDHTDSWSLVLPTLFFCTSYKTCLFFLFISCFAEMVASSCVHCPSQICLVFKKSKNRKKIPQYIFSHCKVGSGVTNNRGKSLQEGCLPQESILYYSSLVFPCLNCPLPDIIRLTKFNLCVQPQNHNVCKHANSSWLQ